MFAGSLLVKNGLWTPAKLFSAGEFGFWYDIHPDYLYQDSAGTIPAVVNQPVGLAIDRSGNNRHGIQSNNSLRPTLRQSGELYYLDQSAQDSHLLFGASFILPSQMHYAIGFNLNSDTVGLLLTGSNNDYYWTYQSGSTSVGLHAGSEVTLSVHIDGINVTGSASNRNGLYTVMAGGNHVGIFVSTHTTLINRPWNSGFYPSSSAFNSQAHLYSIVFRDRMTNEERQLLESYIAQKTGVAL